MKDGDILVNQWHRDRDKHKLLQILQRIAFSVVLAKVQDWLYWKEYKDAHRN